MILEHDNVFNNHSPKKLKASRRPGADAIIVSWDNCARTLLARDAAAMHEMHTPGTIRKPLEWMLEVTSLS